MENVDSKKRHLDLFNSPIKIQIQTKSRSTRIHFLEKFNRAGENTRR